MMVHVRLHATSLRESADNNNPVLQGGDNRILRATNYCNTVKKAEDLK
jgi:hypothetical protein